MTAYRFISFWEQFPKFNHDANAPISVEFGRLGKSRNWSRGSKKWKKNWNLCMAIEYERLIGARVNTVATWQAMCKKVGLTEAFTSIRQCKKALGHIYVNIIDLLECWEIDQTPRCFRNGWELAKYSKATGKLFPRYLAKQDKVLRVLLHHFE